MVTQAEGAEVTVDEQEICSNLVVEVGQVVEVHMESTSYEVSLDTWAAFLVVGVQTEQDGSYCVEARYLGCEDVGMALDLQRDYGDKVMHIHFCLSRPCLEPRVMEALHVVKVRLWKWTTFKGCEYVPKEMGAMVQKWLKEAKKDVVKSRGNPKPAPRKPALKKKEKGAEAGAVGAGGSGAITPEMKESFEGMALVGHSDAMTYWD